MTQAQPTRYKRRRRVFILGGGATLGAHQVGALKFLEEQGIRPDAIIGSSIGVINACVYCSGGVARLESAWRDFRSLQQVLRPSLTQNPVIGLSLFSMNGLSRALEAFIDFPRVFESEVEVAFVVLNLSRGRGEIYHRRELADWRELRTISRAGYAIPLLFPPVRFRDEYLVDGGFAWNIPLEYALEIGANEIYILAPIPSQLPFQARLPSFVHLAGRFVDVMWRTIGNMGYLYARLEHGRFHGVPVTIIEPGEEFSGFRLLDLFHTYPAKSRRLMAAGYRDAKREWAARERTSRVVARPTGGREEVA
ncbi:MAG TPA: patatin-like phospholipase family protein [Candidatus Kryptonia bacterium]|nr:patatin-like phospholipase family protein [Candidatus Kryptonia bacterium]